MPQVSLNHTNTVFVPLPVVNVQLFVGANVAHEVQLVVLLMHIWIGGLLSLAVNVRVTVALFVTVAPPLICIEPFGGVISGTAFALAIAPVELLPALSIAHTR